MPPLSSYLQEKGILLPFLFFGFNALLAGALTFIRLYDTTNLEMDDVDEKADDSKKLKTE